MESTVHVISLPVAAAISIGLAGYVWRHRGTPEAVTFLVVPAITLLTIWVGPLQHLWGDTVFAGA